MATPNKYHLEYVYGPFVGRRHVEAYSIEKATEKLWEELEPKLWVPRRFRSVKEIKQ